MIFNVQPSSMRQKLHEYIESGDEKLLKLMYAVAREYTGAEEEVDYQFSKQDLRMLEDRRARRLSGESKTYSWEETKAIITGKGGAQ